MHRAVLCIATILAVATAAASSTAADATTITFVFMHEPHTGRTAVALDGTVDDATRKRPSAPLSAAQLAPNAPPLRRTLASHDRLRAVAHGYYFLAEEAPSGTDSGDGARKSHLLRGSVQPLASLPMWHNAQTDDGRPLGTMLPPLRSNLTGDELRKGVRQGRFDFVSVTLPASRVAKLESLTLRHPSQTAHLHRHRIAEQHRANAVAARGFEAEQLTAAPPTPVPTPAPASTTTLRTIQQVDVDTQPTLVLLSSGYTSEQQQAFWDDVVRATNALKGTQTTVVAGSGGEPVPLDSSPWPRYYPLLNVYAVFSPSNEAGASTPVGPQHNCDPITAFTATGTRVPAAAGDAATPACVHTIVDNNLGCAFGTPEPRMLSCDYARVMTLASRAPDADAVIVIVNDAQYGGTGGEGVAVVSNGADLPHLLVNQLNHALGGLGDEFDYGFAEPAPEDFRLPNCDDRGSTDIAWNEWIRNNVVDASPPLGCTFSNFHRPTADGCLMRSKQSQMCPVCRERMTIRLLQKQPPGSPAPLGGMSLAEPRCPPEHTDVLIRPDESVTLTINHRFTTVNRNVSVLWSVPLLTGETQTIPGLPNIFLRGNELRPDAVISVVIHDQSEWVSSGRRASHASQFLYNTTFRVRVVDSPFNCTPLACTATTGSTFSYACSQCMREGGCNIQPVLMPEAVVPPEEVRLVQNVAVVRAVAAVLAVVGVLVVLFIVLTIWQRRSSAPGEILVLDATERMLLVVGLILSFIVFALSVLAIVLLTYYVPRVPVFGRDIFVAAFVFSAICYLLSGIAFCAIFARYSTVAIVSGVVFVVLGVVLFIIGAVAFYVVVNTERADMINWYERQWRDRTEHDPSGVCDVMNYLNCSGFRAPCVTSRSSWCPADCAQTRNANACLTPWQSFIADTLRPITGAALALAFFLLFAGGVAVMFGLALDRLRQSAIARRSYRRDPRAPLNALTDEELRQIKSEFEKADKDGSGKLDSTELLKFLQAVFGDECTQQDKQQIMAEATTADGESRQLTLDEALDIYFPSRQRRPDPRLLTEEEAVEAADTAELIKLQFHKMERYMTVCGSLSPEELLRLHENYLRAEGNVDEAAAGEGDGFFAVVKARAEEHAATEDAEMCRGLTFNELEGLRCAWVSLHPPIVGPLTDAEIETLFKWTHEQDGFVSHEHRIRWHKRLDVRRRGRIGWAEFCFPFAQRALLREARQDLEAAGQDVLQAVGMPETLTKEEVKEMFPHVPLREVFLPHEQIVHVDRVLAANLAVDMAHSPLRAAAHAGDRGAARHRTQGDDADDLLLSPAGPGEPVQKENTSPARRKA